MTVFKRLVRVAHTGYRKDYLNTNMSITIAFSSQEELKAPERYDRSLHKMFQDPSVRFCKGGIQGEVKNKFVLKYLQVTCSVHCCFIEIETF